MPGPRLRILIGTLAATPCVAASVPADQPITITRTPWGLCGGECPSFAVTVSPDGDVVLRTSHRRERNTTLTRFGVSARQAARFRSLLAPLWPGPGRKLMCGGKEVKADGEPVPSDARTPEGEPLINVFISRVPIFDVRWGPAESDPTFSVCLLSEDQPMIDTIEAALGAVTIDPDGNRITGLR